jgi:hypothetical protein
MQSAHSTTLQIPRPHARSRNTYKEVAFSDAYDEGQKMTPDEAVAYALENFSG